MTAELKPKSTKRRVRNNYRSIYIPEELELALEEIAEENETSFNRMMVKILRAQLESKAYEAFLPKYMKKD